MVNKVILIGNLGSQPELRNTTNGRQVANIRLATNEKFKDSNGKVQTHTEWHNLVVWGNQAKVCYNYLNKGDSIYIEGRIHTSKWTDSEGNDKYRQEIHANNVKFLSIKKQSQNEELPVD